MSDHYGLLTQIHINDNLPIESPVADSRPEDFGLATVFRMNDEILSDLPRELSIDVNSERGFTLSNENNVFTTIMIDDPENHVYTASDATIGQSNAASFAFEEPGDYKFRLLIRDYRDFYTGHPDYSREPRFFQSEGLLHVKY